MKNNLRYVYQGLMALILFATATSHAREPERFAVADSAGKEILVVEQVYNGKRPKNPNTKPSKDPEKFDVDFYQITFKNVTNEPILVKRMAIGVRFGTGTIVGIKKNDSNESWGAGLQERDLAAQPMFDKNVLAPGKNQSAEYFLTMNGENFMDRVIQIEHLGKTYDLKWAMKYSKGE